MKIVKELKAIFDNEPDNWAMLDKHKIYAAQDFFAEQFKFLKALYPGKYDRNERLKAANAATIKATGLDLLGLHSYKFPEDKPIIKYFWEIFDQLNTGEHQPLNHSRYPTAEIAVNREHFITACQEAGIPMRSASDLRAYFPGSKVRKFIESRSLYSRLWRKTVRCYVFAWEHQGD